MSDEVLGVGIIYAPALEPLLATDSELIPVLELEPQTIWAETRRPAEPFVVDVEAVERIRQLPQRKLIHGVGFPVGGSRLPDPRHLAPLRWTIETLGAAWASEHLSFNEGELEGEPFSTGFLLPPRQTLAGVEASAATIRSVAARLPVAFAVETGVNYLRPRLDELSDGAFAAAVAAHADCGILLDLHNVWVNEQNGRQPVEEFLAELQLERVCEIHLAGGFELEGFYLDAHSGEIPAPLLELAARVVPRLPNLRAIVYELMPEFIPRLGLAGVRRQLELIEEIWQARNETGERSSARARRVLLPEAPGESAPSPREWENELGRLVVGLAPTSEFGQELASDPGLAVLRRLAEEVRAGMVVDVLPFTSRLLLLTLGSDGFRALLERYWQRERPAMFATSEADGFARFLTGEELAVPFLLEVLGYECAILRARLSGDESVIAFRHDPAELLAALAAGELPDLAEIDECLLVVDAPLSRSDGLAPNDRAELHRA